MIKKIHYTLFVFLIFILLTNCNSDKKGANRFSDTEIIEEIPGYTLRLSKDSARYSRQEISRQASEQPDQLAETAAKISFSYPHIDSVLNKAVKDSINQFIQDMLLADEAGEIAYNSVENRLDDFIKQFRTAEEEMRKELVLVSKWQYEVKIDIITNSAKILAIRYFEMSYMGGVHPNTLMLYLNFDMKTGRILALEDILVENYQKTLLQAGEKAFKKAMKIAPQTPIHETQYEFKNGNFFLPRNFAITRTGLHFCYNPYDIGPYSLGTLEFEIPFGEILAVLRKEALE
jgi:hypothetical protein